MKDATNFGQWLAVFMFVLLAGSLFHFARKPLETESKK
jgi:hypothetical protein